MQIPTEGFCYVVSTKGYLNEAEASIVSLVSQMPGAQVAVVAPRQIWKEDLPVAHWIEFLPSHTGPIVKTAAILAPFDRVVFLDTDTLVTGNIAGLFSVLEAFDIALAHEPTRGWDYNTPVPKAFCELNTGVIAFRNNDIVRALFSEWGRQYDVMLREQNLKNDQPSFRATLWANCNVRHATLPSEYHLICSKPVGIAWEAMILHGRGRLIEHAEMINAELGPRVFSSAWGVLHGYRGRRLWIRDFLRISRNFFKVLIKPSVLSDRDAPTKWW